MACGSKTKRRAAIVFLFFSFLAVTLTFIPLWKPREDFDVTGTLWLMQNLIPLIFLSVFFVLAAGSGITWLWCKYQGSR